MALKDTLYPQASLEGGNYKPSNVGGAPIVNTVDGIGQGTQLAKQPSAVGIGAANTDWLGMARNAYDSSENWLQVNQRAIWARNFAHYRSEHAPDSPILADVNRHRPKHFWPRTRTLVRAIQAAAASAYFSSSDVVVVEAEDQDDKQQNSAARLMKELLNYRLSKTIPWYKIVLGGIAEASVLGTVASHQSWEYKEVEEVIGHEYDEFTGRTYELYKTVVTLDKPKVRLVPAENIRMSPAADWLDPANSTPYLIELLPMYLGEVLDKIRSGKDSKSGEPSWRDIGEAMLISAGNRDNLDTTRRARSGARRLDPKSNMMETVDEFRIIWIHRNIIRHDGIDWLYYTAGTTVLLSEPVQLATIIPWADGKRDYVLGQLEVETDRPYPSGPVELVSGMQKAVNELKNQRYENVRQVLNRRYLYRAGNQVDVRALSRNVPGALIGISAPGDLGSHVKALDTPDVTGSSYQEEDRINLAMDDLSGSTTGATVQANRKLNETVGGMNLMSESANQVREMELRTFTETWMEPVLTQLVQLEAFYETDAVALTVSAKKAGMRRILKDFFNYRFGVSVNVGMGAVSPTQRMQKLIGAISTVMQVVPLAELAAEGEEISEEIMSTAGYDNGSRFFNFARAKEQQAKMDQEGDPKVQLAREQMQSKAQVEQSKLEIENGKLQLAQAKLEQENQKLQAQYEEMQAKIALMAAQTASTKATAVNSNVTAVFEATQAAGAAVQNAHIAPITDGILRSAGFEDQDGGTVIPEITPDEIAAPVVPPAVENTHPNFPARPQSPNTGILKGFETPQVGG